MRLMLALMLGVQAVPPATPLQPAGKWRVVFAEQSCTLSRSFSWNEKLVTIRLIPSMLDKSANLQLDVPRDAYAISRNGKAAISFRPSELTITAPFNQIPGDDKTRQQANIHLSDFEVASFSDVENVAISLNGSPPISFALADIKGALNPLTKCQDALRRDWSIDPAIASNVVTGPKLKSDLNEVYQQELLAPNGLVGKSGRVEMLLTVGANGKVPKCYVLQTSTDKLLAAYTCALTEARLEYEPARGKDNQPVSSYIKFSVRWQ